VLPFWAGMDAFGLGGRASLRAQGSLTRGEGADRGQLPRHCCLGLALLLGLEVAQGEVRPTQDPQHLPSRRVESFGVLECEQGSFTRRRWSSLNRPRSRALVRHKDSHEYERLLTAMAQCHKRLHQWNEAVACCKDCLAHPQPARLQPFEVRGRAVVRVHRPRSSRRRRAHRPPEGVWQSTPTQC
jgi:hypothetical protein